MGAWRERNFRLLFVGQTTSALGSTLVPVALSFGILDLTGSAADLGFVLGAQSAAMVVFILLGGVIADRISRRTVMMGADALRGCAQVAIGVLLIVGHSSIVALVALAAVVGIGQAMFTPASAGLMPALVPAEHLQQANGLQRTSIATAGIIGPAVAGILVLTVGPGWAIIGDAATFFVSVALLSRLRLDTVPRTESQHWLRELSEGWKDFIARRWFRTIVFASTLFNALYAGYVVLGPVVSKEHYGGAGAWAAIASAGAIGSVIGGILAIRLHPKHPILLATVALAPSCLTPLALAGLLPVYVVAGASLLAGGSLLLFNTVWETAVQRSIPEHILSRASSYDYFGSLVAFPIGLSIAGPIAAGVGVQAELLWIGGLVLAVVLVALLFPSVRQLTTSSPSDTQN